MENLTLIVHSLKKGEILFIRNYYKFMIRQLDNGKKLALFNLIKTNNEITDEIAAKTIFNTKPSSAYSHLKRRLKEDILNLLLTQDSKRRFVTPDAQAEFDARRLIIQGDLLISRGITNEGIKTLEKAVLLSKKYELFHENVIANDILLMHLSIKNGIKTYNQLHGIIFENGQNALNLAKAKNYYNKILSPHLFKLNDEEEQIAFAKEAKNELAKSFKKSNSAKIGFYYYYISVFYFNLIKDYETAHLVCEKFMQLILSSRAIYSKTSLAAARLQLAYISLQLHQFSNAIKEAEIAIISFRKGLINELTTIEILFLANFYSNSNKTDYYLNEALQHPKLSSNNFLPAKWHFYKTWLFFKRKKYDEANIALNYCMMLNEDKTGWLYGFRILDIMISLEVNEAFLISSKLANFKRIIMKQKNVKNLRAKTILKILYTLIKKDFNYKLTAVIEKNNLLLLQEAKEEHLWEPMGYELIRFEEWFLNKLKK